jgi:hypothetical protein
MRRVQNGEDLGEGPHAVPMQAREVLCYFRGNDGDEITAWYNGEQIDAKPLKVRHSKLEFEFGEVVFTKPPSAQWLTTDRETRRAIFA